MRSAAARCSTARHVVTCSGAPPAGAGTWREDYLRPTPPPAVVVRMLNNLRAVFTREGDRIRLGLVLRMRSMLTADRSDDVRRGQSVFN